MELLIAFILIVVFVIFFQGRLREQEETLRKLREHLYLLGQRIASLETPKTPPPPKDEPPVTFPDPSPEIIEAVQQAREKTTAWERRTREAQTPPMQPSVDPTTIADPAARTAAQWERAVPLHRQKNVEPKPEMVAASPIETHEVAGVTERQLSKPLSDAEWEKKYTPPKPVDEFHWQVLELFIGRNMLGWGAVVGFVLAASFFIRYAVKEGWIGPEMKVAGIAILGALFLSVGKYFSMIGWRRFAMMLSSAGIIIIFQAGYASYAFYELISLSWASVVMSLIVLFSFGLAWHYGSRLLGIISIIGGLAVPVLLATEVDRYPQFFTYLVILNVGTLVLTNLLHRAPIALVAFLGTQVEFWAWYDKNYEPEKLGAVLLFQGLFYAVYLIDTTIAATLPVRKSTSLPTWDDAVRAILSPITLFGTVWILLRHDPVYGDWLGIFAFGCAAWYALLAVLFARCAAKTQAVGNLSWNAGPAAATIMSLAFVAVGIPLHFSAAWFALGWGTVFAGLWYFGNRLKNKAFLVMSMIFAVLCAIRLLQHDFAAYGHIPSGETLQPFGNAIALPIYAIAAVTMLSTALTRPVLRQLKKTNEDGLSILNGLLGLAGFGILTAVLSCESAFYFLHRTDMFGEKAPLHASLALTLLWTVLMLILTETGVLFRSSFLRMASLFGFIIIAFKVFAADFGCRMRFETAIFNPYCFGLLAVGIFFIAVGVQMQLVERKTD